MTPVLLSFLFPNSGSTECMSTPIFKLESIFPSLLENLTLISSESTEVSFSDLRSVPYDKLSLQQVIAMRTAAPLLPSTQG